MDPLILIRVILAFLTIFILPLCWPPFIFYKWLAVVIFRILWARSYGKIFSNGDFRMEEDLEGKAFPKGSLLCSMELEGDMSLEELRVLFQRNVLEAGIGNGMVKGNFSWVAAVSHQKYGLRYPELRQCPTRFMGYTFWRDVERFRLEDHVLEMKPDGGHPENGELSLALIHEDLINRSYLPGKSPWDILLIRNCGRSEDKRGSLIIARFHHSMADAISIMKLLVECLGQQPLNTAQPQPEESQNAIFFVLAYPFRILGTILKVGWLTSLFWNHSWKKGARWKGKEDAPQIVRMSPKLCLDDLKGVGKGFGTTTSSVLLALICGGIRDVDPDMGKLLVGYILPKSGHPGTFENHASGGVIVLTTNENCPLERLRTCDKVFKELKASRMDNCVELLSAWVGAEPNPIRRFHIGATLSGSPPVGITNIAGEANGFSIGGRAVCEVIFSVGTLDSSTGVVFCVSSYKDHCCIAVISSGGVLDSSQVAKLADGMKTQLDILKQL